VGEAGLRVEEDVRRGLEDDGAGCDGGLRERAERERERERKR